MKLTLFYCGIPLGALEKTEKGYTYISYISNEQMAKDKKILTSSEYSLWNSFKRNSWKLFLELERIIADCDREDIRKRAEIDRQDSAWEKLIKLSHLKFFSGFYVQQTKDMKEESKYHLKAPPIHLATSQDNKEQW